MIDFEKIKRELVSTSIDWVDEARERPYEAKLRCLYRTQSEGDCIRLYPSGFRGRAEFPIFKTRYDLQTYLQDKMRDLTSQVDEISNVWHKNHAHESVKDYGFVVLASGPDHFKIILRVLTATTNAVDIYLQPEMENI